MPPHLKFVGDFMEVTAIVLSVAAVLIAAAFIYPYAWGMFLRFRMLSKLRAEAKEAGFKCRRLYKSILLVKNRSAKYDIVIYDDETLYAVKLWSSYFLHSELIINGDGRVYELRKIRDVFKARADSKGRFIKGFSHAVPRTRLPQKYTQGRNVENILLVYPSYDRIAYVDGRRRVELKTEDGLFEKTIYSPFALASMLKRKAEEEDENEKEKFEKTSATGC